MKIKTTKTLAKFLSEKLKEHETTKNYTLTHEKVPQSFFIWQVDFDYLEHETDFDYIDNKYNVFKIVYPCEHYANNLYLTTKDLNRIFNKCDHTANGFINAFIEYIEI